MKRPAGRRPGLKCSDAEMLRNSNGEGGSSMIYRPERHVVKREELAELLRPVAG